MIRFISSGIAARETLIFVQAYPMISYRKEILLGEVFKAVVISSSILLGQCQESLTMYLYHMVSPAPWRGALLATNFRR
jgi:hypothetical protein